MVGERATGQDELFCEFRLERPAPARRLSRYDNAIGRSSIGPERLIHF